jgi:DNA mismatch repair protein MutS2
MSTNGRECVVAFGMIKSTVTADRLERVSKSQLKREQQQANLTGGTRSPAVSDEIRERRLHFKQEIDVRGMRGEEALMAVTYYMDDAILLGVGEVRILHGTGTGALRQLIRQYLSTLPGVRSYHDEHVQFGGAGITVVELE